MSADPLISNPDDTQNYNRYSYVHNRPMFFTDPSGFETDDACGGICTVVEGEFAAEKTAEDAVAFDAGAVMVALAENGVDPSKAMVWMTGGASGDAEGQQATTAGEEPSEGVSDAPTAFNSIVEASSPPESRGPMPEYLDAFMEGRLSGDTSSKAYKDAMARVFEEANDYFGLGPNYNSYLSSNSDIGRTARVIFRETEGIRAGPSSNAQLTNARAALGVVILNRQNSGIPIGRGTQPATAISGRQLTDISNNYPPSVAAWKSSVDAAIQSQNMSLGSAQGANLFNFRVGSGVNNSTHKSWGLSPVGHSDVLYNSNSGGDVSKGHIRFYYFRE